MMWAISSLAGNNRVTKALAVRYSAIPLDAASPPPAASGSASRLHDAAHITLPIDVEETVTCFCRYSVDF